MAYAPLLFEEEQKRQKREKEERERFEYGRNNPNKYKPVTCIELSLRKYNKINKEIIQYLEKCELIVRSVNNTYSICVEDSWGVIDNIYQLTGGNKIRSQVPKYHNFRK